MIITKTDRDADERVKYCFYCDEESFTVMRGYAVGYTDIVLCRDCAMQLLRKLSEDLCEFTKGGRHG